MNDEKDKRYTAGFEDGRESVLRDIELFIKNYSYESRITGPVIDLLRQIKKKADK